MLPIIGAAMALAEVVPSIARWIKGDDAGDKAQQIVDLAKRVTGVDDADQAVAAVKADPAKVMDFQVQMATLDRDFQIAELQAETDRLKSVNTTMQEEAKAEDLWTRRWRPLWGFISAGAFGLLVLGIVIMAAIAVYQKDAAMLGMIPQVVTASTALFSIPGAILGITAWHRGKMQRIDAGEVSTKTPKSDGSGVDLDALLARIEAKAQGKQQ